MHGLWDVTDEMNNDDDDDNNDDEEEVREEDGREAYKFAFYAVKACEKLVAEKIGGDTGPVKLKQGQREQVHNWGMILEDVARAFLVRSTLRFTK